MGFVHDVSNLNRLFCRHHTSERRLRWGPDQWIATSLLNKCLRCAMHRNSPKGISFASIQNAELGLADADCILQHRLEHRLQLAGRTEMTFSTSDVAVCCSSDSVRSSVRWRSSLSSRVFSMAMTAWAAKFLQ